MVEVNITIIITIVVVVVTAIVEKGTRGKNGKKGREDRIAKEKRPFGAKDTNRKVEKEEGEGCKEM